MVMKVLAAFWHGSRWTENKYQLAPLILGCASYPETVEMGGGSCPLQRDKAFVQSVMRHKWSHYSAFPHGCLTFLSSFLFCSKNLCAQLFVIRFLQYFGVILKHFICHDTKWGFFSLLFGVCVHGVADWWHSEEKMSRQTEQSFHSMNLSQF